MAPVRTAAYELSPYCEEPGAWHPLPAGEGVYQISQSPAWLRTIAPYLRVLVSVLKHAAPLAGLVLGATVDHLSERLKNDVSLAPADRQYFTPGQHASHASTESDFRVLANLLNEIDPQQVWGGLPRVNTPEGLALYLCRDHAAPYSRNR